MNRLWSYATGMLSRLLDPMEEEVSLGDVAELGLIGGDAFASLLGLVLRRQLQPWKQWQPWFVLVVLVFPVSRLLASFCNQLGGELFPVFLMWSHHRVAYATGVKPSAELFAFLLSVAVLMAGSWSCAFAVGALSGATIYAQSFCFCVIGLTTGLFAGPISIVLLWTTAWGWLPVLITCLLVLGPAYQGVRRGAAFPKMQVHRLVLLTAITAVLGVLAMWTRGWEGAIMENWSQGGSPLSLIQLASRGDAWQGIFDHLLAIFVFASPALSLLASRRIGDRAFPPN